MRAVHHSLTGEAAAVLKLALGRALELCFNVAHNRLPATHAVECSSSSLVLPTLPTLSNALVAALKRAQASQRRRCVDLRSQTPSPPSATHQQTVLTIKVELDQLIVSILDDPSVSSVMREASFSSAAVKACLEEETSLGHHGSASSALQFLTSQPDAAAEPEPESPRCICTKDKEADVRTILEVMSPRKKQGTRRINPVVVGDSASAAEASVAELMRRIETGGGDVPDDLRGARVLRLHLSHARVRLMARADVDPWAADLRRTVANAKANVIYVGDMRWAVDDDQAITPHYYSAAYHMAAALAQLLGELRASGSGRAWLVAAASYQTYVRCQRRALMTTWALQPVSVPAGAGIGPRAAVTN